MARRVFLHVGCPKTGTSFIQGVVWNNRAVLEQQGLVVPAAMRHHFRATLLVRDYWSDRSASAGIAADWAALLDAVKQAPDDVLITHELFGPATAARASFAIEAFDGAETHVVITARDMARQLPSSWQQSIKQGGTQRLQDFAQDVMTRGPQTPWFWPSQDLVDLTSRWGGGLPTQNVHLVTVPPQGADPTLLWSRFASVLGIEAESVDLGHGRRNESIGHLEAELLRRINEIRLDKKDPAINDQRWFKNTLAKGILAQRTPPNERVLAPAAVHDWLRRHSRETVAELSRRSYQVAGDLHDLIPAEPMQMGPDPGEATADDLLTAATGSIVALMEVHRRTVRKKDRIQARARSHKRTAAQLRKELTKVETTMQEQGPAASKEAPSKRARFRFRSAPEAPHQG